jgi:hypothetical protein
MDDASGTSAQSFSFQYDGKVTESWLTVGIFFAFGFGRTVSVMQPLGAVWTV